MTLNKLIEQLESLKSEYKAGNAEVQIPLGYQYIGYQYKNVTDVIYDSSNNTVKIDSL